MSTFKVSINWQLIETAPREHNESLLLCRYPYRPCIGRWWQPTEDATGRWLAIDPEGLFEDDDAFEEHMSESRYDPTHWAVMFEGPTEDDLP